MSSGIVNNPWQQIGAPQPGVSGELDASPVTPVLSSEETESVRNWLQGIGGTLPVVLASGVSTEAGCVQFTGSTSEQFTELCDLTGKLRVDDRILIECHVTYTGSTNTKTVNLRLGSDTSGALIVSSARNTAPDTGIRFEYEIGVVSDSTFMRGGSIVTSFGGSVSSATSAISFNLNPLKLFLGLTLASAAESIGLVAYTVTLIRRPTSA